MSAHWHRYLYRSYLPVYDRFVSNNLSRAGRRAWQPTNVRMSVVWITRRWYERSMAAGGGLNEWQAKRTVPREAEDALVAALQQTVSDWNHRVCAERVYGWWQHQGRTGTESQPAPAANCTKSRVTFTFQVCVLPCCLQGVLLPSAHAWLPSCR